MRVTCTAAVDAVLGEGPTWVEREAALYWLDIKGRKIFRRAEDGVLSIWDSPTMIGSLAPRRSGGFIAAAEQGFVAVDLERGRFDPLFDPEPDRPGNRFNDGKLDRSGRFWAGSMDKAENQESGALYRLDHDLNCTRVDDGYRVTNGPAFSPDGRRMYENDSALQRTYVFDLDDDGTPSNRRIFASFGERQGYPDGMTVDSEGCLWICFWDGWCIRRLSPTGDILATVELPVQRPTSCAFGGAGLDRLFVTSASIGLSETERSNQPCAGGLLLLEPGVSGIAEAEFAG